MSVPKTDNVLMAEVSRGRVAQMAALFEVHHRPLFRYFVSMNRDRTAAEDLVQEVFLRMLRYRASYDPEQSFTGWMYRIARNAMLDVARKRRSEVVDIDEYASAAISSAPDPEQGAVRGQDVELLRRALAALPSDKREVLVLSRFQGMKYEDIAEVLGCEVGTVKVRVYRAMRALELGYYAMAKERVS